MNVQRVTDETVSVVPTSVVSTCLTNDSNNILLNLVSRPRFRSISAGKFLDTNFQAHHSKDNNNKIVTVDNDHVKKSPTTKFRIEETIVSSKELNSNTRPKRSESEEIPSSDSRLKHHTENEAITRPDDQTDQKATKSSLPKCVCDWKNCRSYQKAFREVKHPLFDGVVRIKILQNSRECMMYKECLDRTLKVSSKRDSNLEWQKNSGSNKVGNEEKGGLFCKYVIAKHHFTAKHMERYNENPKQYSFVKPFTIHGAKKYLYDVDPKETIRIVSPTTSCSSNVSTPSSNVDGDTQLPTLPFVKTSSPHKNRSNESLLYLQCPNVPKTVVKAEFCKAMEAIRQSKKKQTNDEKLTSSEEVDEPNRRKQELKSVDCQPSRWEEPTQKKGTTNRSIPTFDHVEADYSSNDEDDQTTSLIKIKDDENMMLKDQLEAVKSQIAFLHDVVVKLQEQSLNVSTKQSYQSSSVTSSIRSRSSFVSNHSVYHHLNQSKSRDRATSRVGRPSETCRGWRSSAKTKQDFVSGTVATYTTATSSSISCNWQGSKGIPPKVPTIDPNSRRICTTAKIKYDPPTRGPPTRSRSIDPPDRKQSSNSIPNEINLDDGSLHTLGVMTMTPQSSWREGDWSVGTNHASDNEEDEENDDDDGSKSSTNQEDNKDKNSKLHASHRAFVSKYKQLPDQKERKESNNYETPDQSDDEDMFDDTTTLNSRGTSTIATIYSKSVRSIPQEFELTKSVEAVLPLTMRDGLPSSHSLKPPPFYSDSSPVARVCQPKESFHSGSTSAGTSTYNRRFVRDRTHIMIYHGETSGAESDSTCNLQSQECPDTSLAYSPSSWSQLGDFQCSLGQSSLTLCQVTSLEVTDPYGDKGFYTGSINVYTRIPHGHGRLEYGRTGRWYEGDWKDGRWTGYGRLSNGDNDLYEGQFKYDLRHGYGNMRFADGRTFEGEYRHSSMIRGKMTYPDGSFYEGSWLNGMRHGFGRCIFTDGSWYDGEFKKGELHGYGKMVWSDGGYHVGYWLDSERHGHGREVGPDGTTRHEGEWIKGQPVLPAPKKIKTNDLSLPLL